MSILERAVRRSGDVAVRVPKTAVIVKGDRPPLRHRGHKGWSPIDDPVETASKYLDIEIDQEAKAELGELQVGQYLGAVDG
jgi:hypothetical protein